SAAESLADPPRSPARAIPGSSKRRSHCCAILSQLAIDQRVQSLAREFFSETKRVINWVAVQFRVGVQPPTIAAKPHAMRTKDLNQLVEVVTRKRQELLLTSAHQTAHRRPSPPRPRWTPSPQTPRAGEAYYSLSCQPSNASRPFLQALGTLEGYLRRFLLDSGAVESLVNPKAFPDLHHKFRAGPSPIKPLSAEGKKVKAIGEKSLKVTVGKET
ncbi:unnamed protein product, partial [Taenia asiatica]|uniref:DUF5726 domain-containing protein n=1 Tax=Taenia asiatica TaxID=60517 RepID=A0A0R3W5Z0_TAEAS